MDQSRSCLLAAEHTRQPRRRCLAAMFAAFSLSVAVIRTLPAAEPGSSKSRAGTTASEVIPATGTRPDSLKTPFERLATIRLNYVRTPWHKVLQDYADVSHQDLVAKTVPAGNFSRLDFGSHSLDEALRILNRELHPLGYRLLDKGERLVLIELRKKQRREYLPAEYRADEDTSAEEDDRDEAATEQSAGSGAHESATARTKREAGTIEQVGHTENRSRKVRRVSAEADARPTAELKPEAMKLTTVRLRERDAVTVSRIMYNVFKPRAELVDDGPRGLQGFRVYRTPAGQNGQPLPKNADSPIRFTVGIDEDHNRLVIEAAAEETPSVVRLIKTLDVLPGVDGGTVKAVVTNRDAGQIEAALQPEIDRLANASRKAARKLQVAARNRGAEFGGDDDGAAEDGEPADAAPLPKKPAEGEPGEGADQPRGAQSLIQSLKGDVQIESIPELGIMVIIGNEKDAEAVVSVIQEIERLSAGAVPDVELVFLKHVNSESLAALLTSVYERLSPPRSRTGQPGQQQQQNVLVIPVVRPNAVLIVAAKVDIESARELAEQLDQPGDPRTEYKVFRLKFAIPSQVQETVEAVYGGGTAQGQGQPQAQSANSTTKGALAPQVRITADPRTNSVIVQARPRDMREVALLIRDLDSAESAAVSQIRIFPLKTAVADELAATLQTAILSLLSPARITATQQGGPPQAGSQTGAPELREVKSMILQFLDEQDGHEQMLQSGILADIRITADLRTNSIVVTAPEQSLELVGRLIKQFDQPSKNIAEIKVLPMSNGDAQSTVTLLNGLFGVQPTQRTGQGGQGGQFGQNFPGLQVAGADDASSTLIPLKFSVDIRTNSIIAIGGAEALRVVEAIVYRLDESGIRQRQNSVYKLKNTPAADIATAISQFLQTQRQVETADPGLISPFEQIEREVIVVPEPVGNSLLISATPRFFDDIMALVKDLDAAPKQVLIQALLVEVQLDNADEWGVELGLQDSVLFDRSLLSNIQLLNKTTTLPQGTQTTTQTIVSQTATPGYTFNNQPLGNNSTTAGTNPATVGGQGLTNFNLGRINSDLGYGGLVLAAGSESVNALLRAVAARRRVDVLSRPQIRTLDNQIANIQVGQEIPRVGNFTMNQQTGYASPMVEQRSVGIILQVTPRVTPEGMVVMQVVARKDALSANSVPLFANPNGSQVTSPIIDTTNALTTVSVRNGQTIVLGGMITKRDESIERKVPVLGDVPILGQAFRYDYKRTIRTELLIFLTPRVVASDAEAEIIKEIEAQRMNFIEAEAEMIHGPLLGVQAPFTGPESQNPPALNPPDAIQPPPPAPGLPMSGQDEDDDVPTTLMRADGPQAVDEDLELDLSRRPGRGKRDSAVQSAGFSRAGTSADSPGRTMLARPKPGATGKNRGPRTRPKTLRQTSARTPVNERVDDRQ